MLSLPFFFKPSFTLFLKPSFTLFVTEIYCFWNGIEFTLFLRPSFTLFLKPSFTLFVTEIYPFCNRVDLPEEIAHLSPSDVFIWGAKVGKTSLENIIKCKTEYIIRPNQKSIETQIYFSWYFKDFRMRNNCFLSIM